MAPSGSPVPPHVPPARRKTSPPLPLGLNRAAPRAMAVPPQVRFRHGLSASYSTRSAVEAVVRGRGEPMGGTPRMGDTARGLRRKRSSRGARVVDPSEAARMPRWWLERFTLAEMRELTSDIWAPCPARRRLSRPRPLAVTLGAPSSERELRRDTKRACKAHTGFEHPCKSGVFGARGITGVCTI